MRALCQTAYLHNSGSRITFLPQVRYSLKASPVCSVLAPLILVGHTTLHFYLCHQSTFLTLRVGQKGLLQDRAIGSILTLYSASGTTQKQRTATSTGRAVSICSSSCPDTQRSRAGLLQRGSSAFCPLQQSHCAHQMLLQDRCNGTI